jgi:three-Cys-motif partner protein
LRYGCPSCLVSKEFFKVPQGAAILKHAILENYLPAFVGKVGLSAPAHRVFYLDGFAGAGVYDDGTPGSPLLAARTARYLAEHKLRNLECIYVERDLDVYDRLVAALADTPHRFHPFRNDIADVIDDVLRICDGAPLFAFLDPFGLLGMPFERVVQRVLARSAGQGRLRVVTEILLNFSLVSLHRVGSQLTATPRTEAQRKARETMITGMDASLGGPWWHPIWLAGGPNRDFAIIDEYRRRLESVTVESYGSWVVPVSDHPRASPVYLLVLFTAHREGFKTFNDALSSATERYEKVSARGKLPFDRNAELQDVLKANLERLLEKGRPISVDREFREIFGSALGRAREKHLRGAIKELYREGKTSSSGKGSLYNAWIEPTRIKE